MNPTVGEIIGSHVGYLLAIAGLVWMHNLRTRLDMMQSKLWVQLRADSMKHIDHVMESYRKESDSAIRRLLIIADAAAILRRLGHEAEGEALLQKAINAKDAGQDHEA